MGVSSTLKGAEFYRQAVGQYHTDIQLAEV